MWKVFILEAIKIWPWKRWVRGYARVYVWGNGWVGVDISCYPMFAELKRLVLEAKASLPQVVKLPDFSPSARLKLGTVDFAKLNDAGIGTIIIAIYHIISDLILSITWTDMSHDSEDSGIVVGHALLESPCLPLTTSSPISTHLTKRLCALEPFPLSPGLDDKL